MADGAHFKQLLAEFRRAGVDPDSFTAVLSVSEADALGALRALPDDAGPAAFLAELRRRGVRPVMQTPTHGMRSIGEDGAGPPAAPGSEDGRAHGAA
jgi:hypothetical protein